MITDDDVIFRLPIRREDAEPDMPGEGTPSRVVLDAFPISNLLAGD